LIPREIRRWQEVAIRREDLAVVPGGGEVVFFPTGRVRARAARQQALARARRRVGSAILLVFVVAGVLIAGGAGRSASGSGDGAPRAVTVAPGETLWQIAGRYAPEGIDRRAYVDELVSLNDLSGTLQAGARLRLP
jgi:hypothetical protein